MHVPMAWLNLIHDKGRSLAGVAGITFSITLIFVQLGFYDVVLTTATLFYDQLDFDLVLVSPIYEQFTKPHYFPESRLELAASVSGVQRVIPLYVGNVNWTNTPDRLQDSIFVFAFDPEDRPFLLPELADVRSLMNLPDSVLMDELTMPTLGPNAIGVRTIAGKRMVEVVGNYRLGAGFAGGGSIMVSPANYKRLETNHELTRINFGLIKLRSGADPLSTAERIQSLLPADVVVKTREKIRAAETDYWVHATSVGVIFGSATIVAFIVGIVVVFQVLSSDIIAHFAEFATMRAMGYSLGYLSWLVVWQSLILATASYGISFLIASGFYSLVSGAAHIPVQMTAARAGLVFFLAIFMCASSALLAGRRIRNAQPADLF